MPPVSDSKRPRRPPQGRGRSASSGRARRRGSSPRRVERARHARKPSPLLALWRDPSRRLVSTGGLFSLGLGAVGAGASEWGTVLVLAGGIGFMVAIHTFGRLGPDDGR